MPAGMKNMAVPKTEHQIAERLASLRIFSRLGPTIVSKCRRYLDISFLSSFAMLRRPRLPMGWERKDCHCCHCKDGGRCHTGALRACRRSERRRRRDRTPRNCPAILGDSVDGKRREERSPSPNCWAVSRTSSMPPDPRSQTATKIMPLSEIEDAWKAPAHRHRHQVVSMSVGLRSSTGAEQSWICSLTPDFLRPADEHDPEVGPALDEQTRRWRVHSQPSIRRG